MQNIFFKDKNIPYIEARYTSSSNKEYKEHFHTTLSIGAITNGKATFKSNHTTHLLKENMLVILNPFTPHACNPLYSNFRSYYMLYVDTTWAYELQKTLFPNIKSFVELTPTLLESAKEYQNFIALNKTLFNPNLFYLQKQEAIEEFFIAFFSKYTNLKTTPCNYKETLKIQKAKEFIEQNYTQNITIEEIANTINISPFYFSRLFKKATGISPYQYLLNIKIQKAKEALLDPSTSIATLAYTLNFSDQSHFNRVFKALTTLTPHEYKKAFIPHTFEQ